MARAVLKSKQSHKEKTADRASGRMAEGKSGREINAGAISFSRAELFCAGAVFLVALILYTWTLAPTVTPTDSGELILAARGLGSRASAGRSSLGHSRASRIARSVGKRCGADQFFVCLFRRARLRGAHSCRGGINDHHCISPCLEESRTTEEKG